MKPKMEGEFAWNSTKKKLVEIGQKFRQKLTEIDQNGARKEG